MKVVWHSCVDGDLIHPGNTYSGADPGFSYGGGGGRKRLCARTHITSAAPNSLSAVVQGLLKGRGSSRVV